MEISTHLEDSRERKFSHRDPEQVLSKTGIARHTCPVCFLAFSDLGWTRHLLRNPACAIELLRPGKTEEQNQRKAPPQEETFQELHNTWKQEKRASHALVSTAPTINCNSRKPQNHAWVSPNHQVVSSAFEDLQDQKRNLSDPEPQYQGAPEAGGESQTQELSQILGPQSRWKLDHPNIDFFPWRDSQVHSCQDHPTFRFWHQDHGYVPFHCGSWNCSSCAPVKVENIASRMVKASLENDLTRHLALTLDPKLVQGDPWEYLQKTWNKMRVYLWRLSKKRHRRMKWQKVVQIQPGTGLPHYHLMISQYIPFKWVMKAWKAVGGGSVYIRYVKIDTVSGFIKGYFTRQVLGIDFPSRKRRYSTSRSISLAMPKKPGWELRQWISAPAYSKKGYVTGVEREDFVLPPSAWLSGTEEPPGSGDLQEIPPPLRSEGISGGQIMAARRPPGELSGSSHYPCSGG